MVHNIRYLLSPRKFQSVLRGSIIYLPLSIIGIGETVFRGPKTLIMGAQDNALGNGEKTRGPCRGRTEA